MFVFQGEKGERGSPGKTPHGVIKFSDTANNCTLRMAGTVRYSTSQKALQLCDGSSWLPLMTGKGHVADKPGRHCLDILNSGELQIRANGHITKKRREEIKKESKSKTHSI